MAEIKVERKQRNIIPLLLGLLALAALLWWFLSRNRNNDTAVVPADTAAVVAGADTLGGAAGAAATTADSAAGALGATAGAAGAATGNAVEDFATFVSNSKVERNEDQQHEYTAGALRRLASALEGMNPGGAAGAQISLIRQKADSLQITSPNDDRHADMTRAAFTAANEVMAGLPAARSMSSQMGTLRSRAQAVSPDRHMLEQKNQIQAYFDAASSALRAMGSNRNS